MYHECIITVLPKHRQNFTTVLLPLHRSIIQTTKHIAKPVSEPPQSQLKGCQDIAKRSLVYRRFIVNASRPRSLRIIHSMSVSCQTIVAVSSARYLFSSPCPQHAISSRRVPSTLSLLAVPLVPLQSRQGVSPTNYPCVLRHHGSASSPRQYVTNSSSKHPLVLGILSKTLPKHRQSTVRESCLIKSFSTRHQIISDELPVLLLSRPHSSSSSRS